MPRDFGALSGYIEADLRAYELPADQFWMQPQMQVRHAIVWRGQIDLDGLVERLDKYGERMGGRRHGKLEYESWDHGRVHGVASYFAIVDLAKHMDWVKKFERDSERRNVLAEVRAWPWWRRLFMPREES